MTPRSHIPGSRRRRATRTAALAVAVALSAGALSLSCEALPANGAGDAAPDEAEEEPMTEWTEVFETAVESRGAEYAEAEDALIAAGEEARWTLKMNTGREDPIARLIAAMLLDRLDGGDHAFLSTEGTLDVSERLAEGSAIGTPSPLPIARGLYSDYECRSALRAALLLVKREGYPPWKTETLLAYLELCPDPATTAALVRFAVETPDDEFRERAIDLVRRIDDPDLALRVAYEQRRASARELPFPPELAALAPGNEDR